MSAGQYARHLVIASLDERDRLQSEISSLREAVSKLSDEIRSIPAPTSFPAPLESISPQQLATLRADVLSALQALPKEIGLDSHLLAFLNDFTATQRDVLNRNFAALRRDLANAVLALLVGAGKLGTDEANAWVNTHLRRKD